MSEEPIRDRLRRLRREPERIGEPAERVEASAQPASEGDRADVGVSNRTASDDPRVGDAVPADAQALDWADNSAVSQDASCAEEAAERSGIFARLLRRARIAASIATGSTTPTKTRAHDPWVDPIAAASPPPRPRELTLGPPQDLVHSERGTWARTLLLERAHRHGSFTLEEVLTASRSTLAERARDERIADIDFERAVFFDTETTGLSGGAGTYVFLVGLGQFTPSGFALWQGFLPHPADEKALLEEVAERIAGASAILSFFGKSFDRHRLEDKMRLHGVAPPFAESIHLDLYYPLRRAHRGRFENCRLKTLERELVGVQRADDLPGSFAPAAWFDFLAQRPHQLEGVFRHNADDVLSLVTLAAHLSR